MAESIFYSTVDKKVRDVLDTRKRIYRATERSSNDYAWLYRKMAYATATATNPKTSKSASIVIPARGGLGRRNQQGNSQGGLYKGVNYTADGRFLPKPHLNVVKLSSDGDYGTILKCNITFTVYSRTDLDALQPFFDIGADLVVNYGWNRAGFAAGDPGTFNGVIYNFSYSLNAAGHFDCTCDAMSAGINALAVSSNASKDSKGQTYTDALGTNLIPAATVLAKLKLSVQTAQTLSISHNQIKTIQNPNPIFDVEIGAIQFDGNPESEASTADNASAVRDATAVATVSVRPGAQSLIPASLINAVDSIQYYVSLESIVATINEFLLKPSIEYRENAIELICNEYVTRGFIPNNTGIFVSANPFEVVFPGYGDYGSLGGSTYGFEGTDQAQKFMQGSFSKIMINIQFLVKLFYELGAKRDDQTKSVNQTVANFLKRIFDMIYNNSGTRIKLSTSANPKNPNQILIVDVNYFDTKPDTVYEITAVTNESICRNVSLVAKVPSEMQTAAFVQNRTTVAIQGVISAGTDEPTKPEDETESPTVQLSAAKLAVNYSGLTEENINNLQAALKRVYVEMADAAAHEALPVPIDFSATLDGINGIIFGNTVTCNYLPSIYKRTDIAFTVTKVDHTISNQDWITTISTVCRLVPKD